MADQTKPGTKDTTMNYETPPLCYDCLLPGQDSAKMAACKKSVQDDNPPSCSGCTDLQKNYVLYESYVDDTMGWWQAL